MWNYKLEKGRIVCYELIYGDRADPTDPMDTVMVRGPKNCNFAGRSEILDRLKEEFGHRARCKVFGGRSRACLYGLGGVGSVTMINSTRRELLG